MTAAEWRDKHPCTTCGQGYGACSEGWIHSLQCCADCAHPTRRDGYTDEELSLMWEGQEERMPPAVRARIGAPAARALRRI